MTKPERIDICRYCYILSDVVNTVIFVFALLIFIGMKNADANATLGGIYVIFAKTVTAEEAAYSTTTFFIMMCITYVIADIIGFIARYTLKNRSHRFWPHLVYIVPSYFLLFGGINIVTSMNNPIPVYILIGWNFVFALGCAIFGMVVHNDD